MTFNDQIYMQVAFFLFSDESFFYTNKLYFTIVILVIFFIKDPVNIVLSPPLPNKKITQNKTVTCFYDTVVYVLQQEIKNIYMTLIAWNGYLPHFQ